MTEASARDIARGAAEAFLSAEAPDELEDFGIVFDAVYRKAERKIGDDFDHETQDFSTDALGFDASLVGVSMLSLVIFTAGVLAKAALLDFLKRDTGPILDKVEEALAEHSGRPELVRKIRVRVERIISEL